VNVVSADGVMVRRVAGEYDPAISAVIKLGDANRKTLGFMPRAGFVDAASRNCIIVAESSDGVVGYCLFDGSGTFVRIAHLCVAADSRGNGVARSLVAEVESANPGAYGIRLKCRRDWPAARLWPVLGFTPMNEVAGRSHARHPLTIWWKPLSMPPDLFSPPEEPADEPLKVSLDSSVFSDLHCDGDPVRQRLAAPIAILSGDQRVALKLPHCTVDEANQTRDKERRTHLLRAQHSYQVLPHTPEAKSIHASLLRSLSDEVLRTDRSLRSDAWVAAESIAGGCDVLLTRDENAIAKLGPVALDSHGLAMMLPSELADHVRRRESAGDYRPASLAQTGVAAERVVTSLWSVTQLDHLLNREDGERKSELRERLRIIAEAPPAVAQRFVARTPNGAIVAAWALLCESSGSGKALRLPLLRIAPGPLARTLGRQILFLIRKSAVDQGAREVIVVDPKASSDLREMLAAEGFAERRAGNAAEWACLVIDEASPWSSIEPVLLASSLLPSTPPRLLTLTTASELERRFWPLKITDAPLPTYLIPIRGPFADELLGHAPTLIPRSLAVGLARENVYYRAPSAQPSAPARILWYSSGRDRQVVACSRLVDAMVGEADAVHREFKHLGVWTRAQVRAAAHRGRIGAVRFADTEVFPHPVSLEWLRALSPEGAKLPSQGPRKVSEQLFAEVYRKGRFG
jgi:hypothetical protein